MTEPLTTTTPPETGGLSVEAGASLLALLPDTAPEPPPETPPEAPEAPPEPLDVPEKEPDEPEPPAPVLYEVTVDGEKLKVELPEALKGYQRRQDYDRRVNKIQQERRDFESQKVRELAETKAARDKYLEKIQGVESALKELAPDEPDLERIRKESPDQFPTAVAEWQLLKDKREKLAREKKALEEERSAEQAEAFHVKLQEEADKLREIIPELKDEAKAPALREKLLAEGEHRGFTRNEVALTSDHRLVAILHDAMKYRELVQKKEDLRTAPTKEAPKAAPTLTPGTRTAPLPQGRKEAQEAFKIFKGDPSIKKAAAVLEKLFP